MPKKSPWYNKSSGIHFLATPESSVTRSIKYLEKNEIVEVEYNHGDVYQYFDVPVSVWNQYEEVVRSGRSSGEFLNGVIKKYACIKL
ncbi:MAG: KTSC domain-containing protein [Chitinophagaceae bacterium]